MFGGNNDACAIDPISDMHVCTEEHDEGLNRRLLTVAIRTMSGLTRATAHIPM